MFSVTFRVLSFILFLTLSFALFATEMTPQEQDLKMKRLGDEFKAKTGFVGDFVFNPVDMTFRYLKGHFPDIALNKDASEEAQRALAEQLINITMPYIKVPWEQISYIGKDTSRNTTFIDYQQKIGGIGFSGTNGSLNVSFEGSGNPKVFIGNNLAFIEDLSKQMKITKQQAIDIMLPLEKQYNQTNHNAKMAKWFPPHANLLYNRYEKNGIPFYRLVWITFWEGYRVEVDAVTGEVMAHYSEVVD